MSSDLFMHAQTFAFCQVNPFRPTGLFLAPKFIISMKCLIDFYFPKCCFNVTYVEEECNVESEFGIAIMFRS